MNLGVLISLTIIIVTIVSAGIIGMRMRRRIKRAIGTKVGSEAELTSISTWVRVGDAEERKQGGKLSGH